MVDKVRVNLANPSELLELPGVGPEQARAILRFRAEHGPITDPEQLAKILGPWPVAEAICCRSVSLSRDLTTLPCSSLM